MAKISGEGRPLRFGIMCGGHGFPCGWLSLASANVRDYHALGWHRPDEPLHGGLRVRRAFDVPDAALD